jgi:hypothetical protein
MLCACFGCPELSRRGFSAKIESVDHIQHPNVSPILKSPTSSY